jgi:hypothetical protein
VESREREAERLRVWGGWGEVGMCCDCEAGSMVIGVVVVEKGGAKWGGGHVQTVVSMLNDIERCGTAWPVKGVKCP